MFLDCCRRSRLPGATAQLRLKYRGKYNYNGKYAIFSTTGFKSEKEKVALDSRYPSPKEHEFIAILSLDDFLKMFSDPAALADFLRKKAEVVCSQWNQLNSGPDMVGRRKPVGVNYRLGEHRWHPSRNQRLEERSRYNLELSSYSATFRHMQDESFEITPRDLKVSGVLPRVSKSLPSLSLFRSTLSCDRRPTRTFRTSVRNWRV